jgi:diadenosine tetraphosphate (Ap4A) HIT family hydrolase
VTGEGGNASREACVLCRIVAGTERASFVHRDELVSAFLDIRPINPGHLLVIPNDHVERTRDLPNSLADRVFEVGRVLARALTASGLRADGTNLLVADGEPAGQEVFHAHLHVVPRFVGDGFGLARRPGAEPAGGRAELDANAAAIRNASEGIGRFSARDRVRVRLVKPVTADIEYPVVVIADDGNHLVVEGPWAEPEARDIGPVRFEPGDVFTEHYWRDRWYSIKEIRDASGVRKGWYCDVARPVHIEDRVIVSEDLELDLWVSADRRTVLRLDEDEFEERRRVEADPDVERHALLALEELERLADDGFTELSARS